MNSERLLSSEEIRKLAKAWEVLVEKAVSIDGDIAKLKEAQLFYPDFMREMLGKTGLEKQSGQGAGPFLYPIQDVCTTKAYPALTGLVVSTNPPHLPRSGFKGAAKAYLELMTEVIAFDWKSVENPFTQLSASGMGERAIAKTLLKPPYGGSEAGAKVVGRGNRQRIFREALLDAYGGKCSFCGIDEASILEGAHLQAYVNSTPEEQMSVQNGILLCRNHHRLFDRHLLGLTEDGVLVASGSTVMSKKDYLSGVRRDIDSGLLVFSPPEILELAPTPYFINRHKNKS